MRCIVALLALISLLGLAAGQTIFTGEGYSTSQLAFFNEPNQQTFDPDVQTYWNTYIAGNSNLTASKSLTTDMDIWLNNFPDKFDKAIQVKSSTFSASVPSVSGMTATELNSASLKRGVAFSFEPSLGWKYTPSDTTFSFAKATGTPGEDAKGQIISQGITALFTS
jgi:hypothetical protein